MQQSAFTAQNAAPPRLALLSRIAAAAAASWRLYQRRRQDRAAARALHELSDRMLRDLGFRRCEIEPVVRSYDERRRLWLNQRADT